MKIRIFIINFVFAFFLSAGASAGEIEFASPWKFSEGSLVYVGDVQSCATNGKVGGEWNGNPVLRAKADINESIYSTSICSASLSAKADFIVTGGPTLVEYECALSCERELRALPGRASASGFGHIDSKLIVGCAPSPVSLTEIGADHVSASGSGRVCLREGNHTATAELDIQALISIGMLGNDRAIMNCSDKIGGADGLPAGLVLSIKVVGPCLPEESFLIGDLTEDGRIDMADLALLERDIIAKGKLLDSQAAYTADIARPCNGKPDYADLRLLSRFVNSSITPANIKSTCHSDFIGSLGAYLGGTEELPE
jgi:hypothetical protein